MPKKKVKSIDDILNQFKERQETFERMAEALSKISTETQSEKKVKKSKNNK